VQPVPRAVCIGEGLVVLVARDAGPLEQSAVFDRSAGGAEVNVAGVLAGLGVPSGWASRVGADGFGRYLVSSVAERGIDVTAVQVDPARRTGIYIKERGGNTGAAEDLGVGNSRMHYYRQDSAASAMNPEFLESSPLAGLLAGAELVHVTGITPALSSSATACTVALASRPRAGGLVSFDLNYRPALWTDRLDQAPDILAGIMDRVDVAFLGADEADAVWGIDAPDRLREKFAGPRHLIIKNGGGRVTVFDGPERADIAALQVDVVEQIGAGDAFAGGFLAGLLAGLGVQQRTRLGHLCAAAVLTKHSDHVPVHWDDDVSLALECDQSTWSTLRVDAAGLPAALSVLTARGRQSTMVGPEAGHQ
jgi:2-dehydro-3-deoxygluconokinase